MERESIWSQIEPYIACWTAELPSEWLACGSYPRENIGEPNDTTQREQKNMPSVNGEPVRGQTGILDPTLGEFAEAYEQVAPAAVANESVGVSSVSNSVTQRPRQSSNSLDPIKLRYIVGKRTGKDIYGEMGALLIKKGDLIDAKVVRIVEREGKLVELILNMVIDGFHK